MIHVDLKALFLPGVIRGRVNIGTVQEEEGNGEEHWENALLKITNQTSGTPPPLPAPLFLLHFLLYNIPCPLRFFSILMTRFTCFICVLFY